MVEGGTRWRHAPFWGSGAQRLSASWSRAARQTARAGDAADVLNAFRRHGRGRTVSVDDKDADLECSTPFGVMVEGGVAPIGSWLHAGAWCAQRLSASWSRADSRPLRPQGRGRVLNAFRRHGRGRPIVPAFFSRINRCSTPFGVMVEGGPEGRRRPPRRPAPCSTPFGVMVEGGAAGPAGSPPAPCAQRLSASWSRAGDPRAHPAWCRSGAQRLSASWSRAGASCAGTLRRICVLKAFRRHGRGRTFRPGATRSYYRVLNAFRRHGRGRPG